ncbi:hypothetical protein N1851_013952 [Merluccius polli]|uniref:Uncharacterized protein n=1 Tax=Merluccius polli TaxID=89951 RepID=A0AA47MV61_MERPO|nr:hypothetical protein N1851_013952 [Merluccius polli]
MLPPAPSWSRREHSQKSCLLTKSPDIPTWQEIEVLEAVQKALKILQDFTNALLGEEYVCHMSDLCYTFSTQDSWHMKRTIASCAN